jgi:hypothetical protein
MVTWPTTRERRSVRYDYSSHYHVWFLTPRRTWGAAELSTRSGNVSLCSSPRGLLHPWRWDRQVILKPWWQTTNIRRVNSQKIEDLNPGWLQIKYIGAEMAQEQVFLPSLDFPPLITIPLLLLIAMTYMVVLTRRLVLSLNLAVCKVKKVNVIA